MDAQSKLELNKTRNEILPQHLSSFVNFNRRTGAVKQEKKMLLTETSEFIIGNCFSISKIIEVVI